MNKKKSLKSFHRLGKVAAVLQLLKKKKAYLVLILGGRNIVLNYL